MRLLLPTVLAKFTGVLYRVGNETIQHIVFSTKRDYLHSLPSSTDSIITRNIFCRLMETYPETIPVLTQNYGNDVQSPEYQALFLRVANALDIAINALRSPRLLEKITSHLAMQHAARPGVAAAHFEVSILQAPFRLISSEIYFMMPQRHNFQQILIKIRDRRRDEYNNTVGLIYLVLL